MYKITKQRLSNIIFMSIILFPLVNVLISYLLKGEGLLTLYVGYSIFIFICVYLGSGLKLIFYKRQILLMILIIFNIFLCVAISGKLSSLKEYLSFALCLLYWEIFSDNKKIILFKKYLKLHRRKVYFLQICYYLVILISVLKGIGINQDTWGINSLKGPYTINHILAYELLIFIIINLFYWIERNNLFSSILIILDFSLIMLTGVRGVLIALAVIFIAVFMIQNPHKQVAIGVLAITILIAAFYNTSLFSNLIDKTINAIALGSVTNGRGKIFLSSLSAYFQSGNPVKWIGGIGYDSLLNYNREHIHMSIHAHNDLIDALVQYGLIGLLIYVIQLKKVVVSFNCRFKRVIFLLLIIALAGFNGFYMYQSINISIPIIGVFINSLVKDNSNEYKRIKQFEEKIINENQKNYIYM